MRVSYLYKLNQKGQIIFEVLWMMVFVCGFLAVLSHLSDIGIEEITKARIGQLQKERK